jgi:hypothetical protein
MPSFFGHRRRPARTAILPPDRPVDELRALQLEATAGRDPVEEDNQICARRPRARYEQSVKAEKMRRRGDRLGCSIVEALSLTAKR